MTRHGSVRIIRTVSDLARLSDVELVKCVKAMRGAIAARKRAHEDAIAIGGLPSDAHFVFEEFQWKPNDDAESKWEAQHTRETPIRELPIRTRARHQLQALHVLCLEDLSAISERELMSCRDLGPTSIIRLRAALQLVGLDFAEHPNLETAEYVRNQRLRRLTGDELKLARANLPDHAPVTRLGLKGPTVERAKRAGWTTLGKLREATPRDLTICFGSRGVREVIAALNETGVGLKCAPTPLELWRAGAVDAADLSRPDADDTTIAELRPWVGAIVGQLAAAGIPTLGALRAAADSGQLKQCRGVGAHGFERLMGFLGKPLAAGVRPRVKKAVGAGARSVFDVARDWED